MKSILLVLATFFLSAQSASAQCRSSSCGPLRGVVWTVRDVQVLRAVRAVRVVRSVRVVRTRTGRLLRSRGVHQKGF
jgi:hypothetical protein